MPRGLRMLPASVASHPTLNGITGERDMLSDDALRSRALPAGLYPAAGVTATLAMRSLARWFTGGPAIDLIEGLSYLGGALVLGLAILLLHRERGLLAARLAIVGWIAATVSVGLTTDTNTALGLTPVALAVAIGLSTVFDARGVLRWTLLCAGTWAAVMISRPSLHPIELPRQDLRLLLIVIPTAMLLIVGLSARAAVRGRQLARSAARTARLALVVGPVAPLRVRIAQALEALVRRDCVGAEQAHVVTAPAELARCEIRLRVGARATVGLAGDRPLRTGAEQQLARVERVAAVRDPEQPRAILGTCGEARPRHGGDPVGVSLVAPARGVTRLHRSVDLMAERARDAVYRLLLE